MKIAYLVEVDPFSHSGIIKKIKSQTDVWKLNGHEVKKLIIWPNASTIDQKRYLDGSNFSNTLIDRLPQGFIKTYLTKIYSVTSVGSFLKKFNPDIVYIRQNIWYPGLDSILKRYRTVLEINSVDYLEMEFYSPLKRRIYLYGKEKILNASNGIIAISPAILKHYRDYKRPMKVISNGIDLSKFKVNRKNLSKSVVNLIFVGSKNMHWHGLDRIMELAAMIPEYQFHVVGYDKPDRRSGSPQNVLFHGWLSAAKLNQLYDLCHIGIGSFSNYLVGKETDSTLKVMEYLAKGLPVIMGHRDVDFGQTDFVLKITDDKNALLPLETIRGFIEKNKFRRVTHKEIEAISAEMKEAERIAFFRTIANT